jgi:LmeA-like phospholipid-binding
VRTLLVALIVLLLAAVGADVVAERIVTDRAENRLTSVGVRGAQVDVGGFPFLPQLLARHADHVHVTATALDSHAGRAQDLDVTASDVSLPSGGTATVGSVRGSGLVTYAEVIRRSGAKGVRLDRGTSGRVRLRGSAQVLGQTLPVAAVGKVEAAGRSLRVVPTGFEVAGAQVDSSALLDALGGRFTLVYRLRGLPKGLRVTDVTAETKGFRVTVTGRNVSVPTGS